MSKTFRSVHNDLHDMEVDTHPDGSVRFSVDADYFVGFCVSPSDAPALALAILEAAGYKEEQGNETTEAAHHFGMSMLHLRFGIKEQEYITAEAESQAKLEAEALDLFNAGDMEGEFQSGPYDSFAQIQDYAKPKWLAVARRARELNKEEK